MSNLSNFRYSLTHLACVGLAALSLSACGGSSDGAAWSGDSPSDTPQYQMATADPSPKFQAAATSTTKYFGYALVDCGYDDPFDAVAKTNYVTEVAAFSNFGQMCVFAPSDNIVSRLNIMSQNGMQAMLSVQAIFFAGTPDASVGSGTRFTLRSDYQARWSTFIQTNKLNQHASQIAAFYVADEPGWSGIPYQQLRAAADAVKASFPTVPTAIVEAPAALATLQVPTSIDWIGFDHYAIPNPETDPVFQAELALLKSKRSLPTQKILLVMDAQWFPFYGDAGYPESYMSTIAISYYNIAQANPDVIGIVGYAWPGGLDASGQKGTRELPQNVTDEHKRIGKLITGK